MTRIHRVDTAAGLGEVDALYRSVFGIGAAGTGLNVRLLRAVGDHGGHVLGAYDDARLVGFGFTFLARDAPDAAPYHYSQTVAVAADRQGTGVGRAIKLAQRDAALADGVHVLRWVFDPMHARNAHFNLDVLGGRIVELRRDYYGDAATGVDEGEPTDRCTIEWDLDTGRAAPPAGDGVQVRLPADWRAYRAAAADAAAVRTATVDAIAAALDRGLVAVSCRRVDDENAAYTFAPRDPA